MVAEFTDMNWTGYAYFQRKAFSFDRGFFLHDTRKAEEYFKVYSFTKADESKSIEQNKL